MVSVLRRLLDVVCGLSLLLWISVLVFGANIVFWRHAPLYRRYTWGMHAPIPVRLHPVVRHSFALFCIFGILPASRVFAWSYRRWKRVQPDDGGLCTACSYNLTGNESGTCPECGKPIPTTS
jgi:hypothetical protein